MDASRRASRLRSRGTAFRMASHFKCDHPGPDRDLPSMRQMALIGRRPSCLTGDTAMTDPSAPPRRQVVIAGDVVVDHHLYQGDRRKPDNPSGFAPVRDDRRLLHPLLVPYATLNDAVKEKDRDGAGHYSEMVALAGSRVVWPGDEA
jgi:hypothetical protein